MTFFIKSLRPIFTLDSRSLIAGRILFAIILMYDMTIRFYEYQFIIPDTGFFNKDYFDGLYHKVPYAFSFYRYNSAPSFFVLTYFLGFISCSLLIIGKWTKPALIYLWLLYLSLRLQFQMKGIGFDILIAAVLLWFMVLPGVNKKWSGFKNFLSEKKQFLDFATVGLIIQIILLYFFAYLYKAEDKEWIETFTAITNILRKVYYSTPFTHFLQVHPKLPEIITIATMIIEGAMPLFLLLGFGDQKVRTVICFFYITFHFFIMFFLNVGIFSPLSIVLWVLLLPAWFWEKIFNTKNDRDPAINFKAPLSLVAALLIVIIFYSNISSFRNRSSPGLLDMVTLDQHWQMFSKAAAGPVDLWIVSEGQKMNSPEKWDVLNNRPFKLEALEEGKSLGVNFQWRSILSIAAKQAFVDHKYYLGRVLARYLCGKGQDYSTIKLYLIYRNSSKAEFLNRMIMERNCQQNL